MTFQPAMGECATVPEPSYYRQALKNLDHARAGVEQALMWPLFAHEAEPVEEDE